MRLLKLILQLWTPWTWLGWKLSPEPVPAPVQMKSSELSMDSTDNVEPPAPVLSRTVVTPEPVQRLQATPPAAEQAQALLEYLHRKYPGSKVRAVDVKAITYPQLVEAMGWRARGWDGKDGVGAHLGRLTGGRTFAWFTVEGERKRQRAYLIPLASTVTRRGALEHLLQRRRGRRRAQQLRLLAALGARDRAGRGVYPPPS